jgi:hypothetical protein
MGVPVGTSFFFLGLARPVSSEVRHSSSARTISVRSFFVLCMTSPVIADFQLPISDLTQLQLAIGNRKLAIYAGEAKGKLQSIAERPMK